MMQQQQQQQPPQMLNPPPPTNLSTDQIQKYLDENKQLIMAILEHQNQGMFAECASYQAQLQQNLMFLAKIADAQPQAPTQMPPQSAVQQQQEHYMQTSQAVMSQQQPGFFPPKSPFQLNDQQLQQHTQGQMGMRPGVPSSIYQGMQTGLGNNFMNVQGSQHDGSEAAAGDGLGK